MPRSQDQGEPSRRHGQISQKPLRSEQSAHVWYMRVEVIGQRVGAVVIGRLQQEVDGTFENWELRCSLSEFNWRTLQFPKYQLDCVVDVCLTHLQVWVPVAVVPCFFCLDGNLQLLAAGRPHFWFRSCACVYERPSLDFSANISESLVGPVT